MKWFRVSYEPHLNLLERIWYWIVVSVLMIVLGLLAGFGMSIGAIKLFKWLEKVTGFCLSCPI